MNISRFLVRIRSIMRIRIFLKSELLVLGVLILLSNITFNLIYREIRSDVMQYKTDILNSRNYIIETNSKFSNFKLHEMGTISSNNISYEEYSSIIKNYGDTFGYDSTYVDSIMNRKLEIKREYLNTNLTYTSPNIIKLKSNKRFIIGNPSKHIEIDSKKYEDDIYKNVEKLYNSRHELLTENIELDLNLYKHINSIIYSMMDKNQIETDLLNEKIKSDVDLINSLSIIHILITAILILLMVIDINKLNRQNKGRSNIISILLKRCIDKEKKVR